MSQHIDKESGRLVVIAFGDSTTAAREGVTVYPDLLQHHWQDLQQPITVINAGVRGNHTEHALARIESDVIDLSPDIVIVRFGINDSAIDVWENPPTTVARVPIERFRRNMVTIVEVIRATGAIPLLCTPNPLAWREITLALYGQSPYLPEDEDGFNVLLRDYVAEIQALAVELDIPLVDIDKAFRQHRSDLLPPWQSLLLDGMHPNDEGHRLAARLLLPQLDALLAQRT